jgi:hypothetical protein
MKIFRLTLALLAALPSFANSYTFTPNPADLGDLDHHDATTWGINWSVPSGEQVTGATLTIKNIYDWQVESDMLFIHLLNNPKLGVNFIVDNSADNVISDYFSGQGRFLTSWSDPYGGSPRNFNFVYNFTAGDITTLQTYLSDANGSGYGTFGLGFDPDCHYYNDGVTLVINTGRAVPESGSTFALIIAALTGLFAFRRRNARA